MHPREAGGWTATQLSCYFTLAFDKLALGARARRRAESLPLALAVSAQNAIAPEVFGADSAPLTRLSGIEMFPAAALEKPTSPPLAKRARARANSIRPAKLCN